MRLSYELFAITGGIKYMDAFEKAFLNAYLAGVFEDGKWGAFFIRASGRHWSADRQVETKYQHCCVNQVPRGFANTAESIMTMCGDDYYINLYLQSRIRFGNTTFRISAGYTDYGKVLITVRGAEVGSKLYLRIPEWSANTEVIVGETSIKAEHGKYVCVELTKTDMIVRVVFDMTPEVIDLKDRFNELDADDYHVRRWIDERNGLCDRSMMLKHPMSIVRCGPVMLARSKRFGSGDEMFSGETVSGKTCECSVQPIRHDRLLCGYRVEIRTEEKTYNYIMCDFASAGNRDSEDVKFFTIYV